MHWKEKEGKRGTGRVPQRVETLASSWLGAVAMTGWKEGKEDSGLPRLVVDGWTGGDCAGKHDADGMVGWWAHSKVAFENPSGPA
ncbi:hypothetical protein BM221_000207 [Beauveria bassiana]|uniref:Uncharacterized protein n=1 Tax=Beauveria bassiana TaxID=176275 RepID=A0A2N6NZW5_BEABA|nr:hypothetical protein BM221_000207 [Beauveria bassiana]